MIVSVLIVDRVECRNKTATRKWSQFTGQNVTNRCLNQIFYKVSFVHNYFLLQNRIADWKVHSSYYASPYFTCSSLFGFRGNHGIYFCLENYSHNFLYLRCFSSLCSNYLLFVKHLWTPLDRKELLTEEIQISAEMDLLLKDTNLLSWTPCSFRRQFLIYLKSISTLVLLTWWHLLKTEFCFFANTANTIWFWKLSIPRVFTIWYATDGF